MITPRNEFVVEGVGQLPDGAAILHLPSGIDLEDVALPVLLKPLLLSVPLSGLDVEPRGLAGLDGRQRSAGISLGGRDEFLHGVEDTVQDVALSRGTPKPGRW